MYIREATKEDSNGMSSLAIALTEKYLAPEFPESAGKKLIMSMSSDSIARNLESDFSYHVAVNDDEIVGLIGIKSNTHLYHLFVSENHQRDGIARLLWEVAKTQCYENGNKEKIIVNSSLYAKGVYEKLGFVAVSGQQERNGVTTISMEYAIKTQAKGSIIK